MLTESAVSMLPLTDVRQPNWPTQRVFDWRQVSWPCAHDDARCNIRTAAECNDALQSGSIWRIRGWHFMIAQSNDRAPFTQTNSQLVQAISSLNRRRLQMQNASSFKPLINSTFNAADWAPSRLTRPSYVWWTSYGRLLYSLWQFFAIIICPMHLAALDRL